ncbi:hypothetical protein Tco_0645629 [Tanacetum coccineum]
MRCTKEIVRRTLIRILSICENCLVLKVQDNVLGKTFDLQKVRRTCERVRWVLDYGTKCGALGCVCGAFSVIEVTESVQNKDFKRKKDSMVTYTEAPPSPNYVSDPEYPPLLVYVPYVPKPVYPEFMPPEDDVLPAEEQPLPAVVSPTADSTGYITESDPEEDSKEDDKDPKEDPADYPNDRDDDDEEESSRDDSNDEEEDED